MKTVYQLILGTALVSVLTYTALADDQLESAMQARDLDRIRNLLKQEADMGLPEPVPIEEPEEIEATQRPVPRNRQKDTSAEENPPAANRDATSTKRTGSPQREFIPESDEAENTIDAETPKEDFVELEKVADLGQETETEVQELVGVPEDESEPNNLEDATVGSVPPKPRDRNAFSEDEINRIRSRLQAELEQAQQIQDQKVAAQRKQQAEQLAAQQKRQSELTRSSNTADKPVARSGGRQNEPGFFSRLFGGGEDERVLDTNSVNQDANVAKNQEVIPRNPRSAFARGGDLPPRPSVEPGAVLNHREQLDALLSDSRQDVVRQAMEAQSGQGQEEAIEDPDAWKEAGPNAWKYNGEWQNGTMHGQGRMVYGDGWEYVGSWKNGQMDGQGTLYQPDGTKYEGGFKNGKMHGLGKLTYPDGWQFIGQWVFGKIQGQGTLINPGKTTN